MNAFRTVIKTNCLYGYGKDLDQSIISCLFTKKIADSVLSDGFRKGGAQCRCTKSIWRDDEGSVYKWDGWGRCLYLSLHNKLDTRIG